MQADTCNLLCCWLDQRKIVGICILLLVSALFGDCFAALFWMVLLVIILVTDLG